MTTHISRVDADQPKIVEELRSSHFSVQPIHQIGKGTPDILVGFSGMNFLFEIKGKGGKLTPDEEVWHSNWRGDVMVIHNAQEAIEHIDKWFEVNGE
jgi:hypothetical protein